jgi:primase-polymerase (primpol)-like protein
VPEQLRAYSHFVVWRPIDIQGKIKKVPFNPRTGEKASPTDPTTWGSFAEALRAFANGAGKGIGFVFARDDPFTGTDLDRCIENTGGVAPWAKAIVSKLDSYTEYSPSGTGLHIITLAHVPAGRRKDQIETYSTGRYFTLTANHVEGTPTTIRERQEQQEALYQSLALPAKAARIQPNGEYQMRHDTAVLERATHARNATRFLALWEGKTCTTKLLQ